MLTINKRWKQGNCKNWHIFCWLSIQTPTLLQFCHLFIFTVASNSSVSQSKRHISHLLSIKILLALTPMNSFTSYLHRIYFTAITVRVLRSPHKYPLTSWSIHLHFSVDFSNTDSWFIYISTSKKNLLNLHALCNCKQRFKFKIVYKAQIYRNRHKTIQKVLEIMIIRKECQLKDTIDSLSGDFLQQLKVRDWREGIDYHLSLSHTHMTEFHLYMKYIYRERARNLYINTYNYKYTNI